MQPGDHLFRRESGRMVAALTRIFGVHNLALAEDVVQDAFCRALELWRIRGIPENASAWLMATAKNGALDVLRRERTARSFAPELGRFLQSEWTLAPMVEELFAADAIKDDLLRMMFTCCHPRSSEPTQVALVLHILCGFSVNEIASAFVTTHAAKNGLHGRRRCSREQSGCSTFRHRPISRVGFRRYIARSTCCSTRATTVPPLKRPYVSNSAGRLNCSARCSWSTPSVQRR